MKFRIFIIILLSAIVTFTIQPKALAVLEWEPIGPNGGDQYNIIISPNNPNILFALSCSNLHRSINAGENWEQIPPKKIAWQGIFSLVFDPLDPNHIFIANGELGVWESTDLGDNWTSYNAGLPLLVDSQDLYYPVASLAFDIYGRLHAGMGTWEDSDIPPSWVYRKDSSSEDWIPDDVGIQVTAINLTQRISTLLTVDGNNQLWAMTYGAGIYIYENNAWSSRNGNLPSEALKTTFFLPDLTDSNHLFLGTEQNWIYETNNGGQNWSTMPLPDNLAELDILPMLYTITIDPNNSQIIWTVAIDSTKSTEFPFFRPAPEQMSGRGIYISFNGGSEWISVPGDYFNLVIDPSDTINNELPPFGHIIRSRTWYIAAGGVQSVRKSVDGGASFQTKNDGLYADWIDKIWYNKKPEEIDGRLFVASESGLSVLVDKTLTWMRQKPVDDVLYTWSFAEDYSDNNYIFYGTGNPAWTFTDQRGVYRINYKDGFDEGYPHGDKLLTDIGIWNIITTPMQQNKIYAATQENGIMVSSDYGVNWNSFNDGLTLPASITDILLDQSGNPKLASARTINGILNLFETSWDEEGAVYFYNHETLQWQQTPDITAAAVDLELDPHDNDIFYAATVQGIYKSIDGTNWEVLLPNVMTFDLLIDPIKPGYLYAATVLSVLRSTDGGKQWHEISNGLLRDAAVFTLDIDEATGILYAGTKGQSAYQLLPDTNPQPLLIVSPESLDFGIVPIALSHDLNFTIINDGESTLTVTDVISGNSSFTLPHLTTPIILTPGNEFTTQLRFTPQIVGDINSNFTIESNSSVSTSYDYTVRGVGRDTVIPVPDIKVNGSDENITIPSGTSINIENYLSAGDYLGQDADFWVRLTLPDSTTYWFVHGQGLEPSATPLTLGCFPISDITTPILFTLPNMPSGNYEIYFAVDDGGCDNILDGTWSKVVNFTVAQTSPELKPFPPSLDFGEASIGFDKTAGTHIVNIGESDLIINSIDFNSSDFELATPLSFPITISQGANVKISVTFTPSITDPQTTTMTINNNDPEDPAFSIPLSGSGRGAVLPVPDIKINGSSDVGITIPNGVPINIESYLSAGDYVGRDADYWIRLTMPDLTTHWLVQSQGLVSSATPIPLKCLPIANITRPISMTLPNMPSGNYEIYFAVDDGGCDNILDGTWSKVVNFTVAQTSPELKPFPPSLDFGEASIGFDKTAGTHIVNIGESDLIINSIDFNSSDFELTTPLSFPITISQGANVKISVTFTPSITGPQTTTMTINDNDPEDPAFSIPLSGSGRGAVLPVPDIKINGSSDVGITIPNGVPINIECSLSAGDYVGRDADYWIRLTMPDLTTHWLVQSQGLVSSATSIPLECLPIANITSPISMTLPNMPSGNYEIYFAVDDGGCDNILDGTWSKIVNFTVAQTSPELKPFPPSLDFGEASIGFDKTAGTHIVNIGESDLIINSIDFNSSDFELATPLSFPITISQGANVKISVTFTPSITGPQTTTMTINDNDPEDPAFSIPLSGSGRGAVLPVPDIKINGSSDVGITVPNGVPINIECSLSAGDYVGRDADYWIRLTMPDLTTHWLVQSQGLVSSTTPIPLECLPIANITSPISMTLPNMPSGNYEIYFAVDDGGCDNILDGTWTEYLGFTITP